MKNVFRHFCFHPNKFSIFFSFLSKGISQSALPYRRSVPSWLKLNAEDVKEQIKKLGKKGMTPSQIGKFIFHTGCLKVVEISYQD